MWVIIKGGIVKGGGWGAWWPGGGWGSNLNSSYVWWRKRHGKCFKELLEMLPRSLSLQ